MIRLSATTHKLQAVLAGAVTTNQLHCVVCYSDDNGSTYVGGTQLTSTNDTTAVDICAAPAASTVRDIDNLSIRNRDTAAATVTVMLDSSGADSEIVKATLAVGDTLSYTHGDGWKTLDASGQVKSSASGGGVSDGDKGDITVSSSGAVWTVDNDAITYAKMQNVSATSRVLGRKTAGAGDTEECTLSEILDFIGSAAHGDILYRGASAWARLAAGTSGQYLKTLGAGANPAWDTPAGGSGGASYPQDFRLTLTTGLPVTVSDVTSAGTVYCTPYRGNQIALYSGSAWNIRTSAEFSLALSGLTSGKPYDVFCYDNGGTPTLEFTVWTDDTNRATALAYQDGVLVKSGAATRRYLGTFYTTGTTTTADSEANRYLWNYYNRVTRPLRVVESTSSWTYSTGTFRQANNSAANQVNFVSGVAESPVFAQVAIIFLSSTSAADGGSVGVGVDSTSTNSASIINRGAGSSTIYGTPSAIYQRTPAAGKHYLAWLEAGAGSNTQTWYGTAGVPTLVQAGLFGYLNG